MRKKNAILGVCFILGALLVLLKMFFVFPIRIFYLVPILFFASIIYENIPKRNYFGIFIPAVLILGLLQKMFYITKLFDFGPIFLACLFLSIGLSVLFQKESEKDTCSQKNE